MTYTWNQASPEKWEYLAEDGKETLSGIVSARNGGYSAEWRKPDSSWQRATDLLPNLNSAKTVVEGMLQGNTARRN